MSIANVTVLQCSKLASRSDFTAYANTIKAAVGNNISLLDGCKEEICNALWGSGNPDISGIGVRLRYAFVYVAYLCPR